MWKPVGSTITVHGITRRLGGAFSRQTQLETLAVRFFTHTWEMIR